MRNHAIQLGKLGSVLGIIAGIIEIFFGTQILPWIGNKENPVVLGFITLFLSTIAFISATSALNHDQSTDEQKLVIFLGVLLPATICFTTVGRLWYLPGFLLTVTCLLLGYEFWFNKSKDTSAKLTLRKFDASQIIGGISSLVILASIVLALFNSIFGLFKFEIILKGNYHLFEIFPMDIVRFTKISGSVMTIENIEINLVMYVYIFLILGSVIAFISSLVNSRIIKGIGGILILIGLSFFCIWLPEILVQAKSPSLGLQQIIKSLGIGWYISIIGMGLILISSIFKVQSGD